MTQYRRWKRSSEGWGDGGDGEMGQRGRGAAENNNSQVIGQQSTVNSHQSTITTPNG